MDFFMISAVCDNNNGIGLSNKLPWHLPEDLIYFQKLTKNHILIMGRSTYESIGKPLKNRYNIVLTTNPEKHKHIENVHDNLVFCSLDQIDTVLQSKDVKKKYHTKDVFVIGGEKVYSQFLDKACGIFITRIKKNFNCDSFFPEFTKDYKQVYASKYFFSENENCCFRLEYHVRL